MDKTFPGMIYIFKMGAMLKALAATDKEVVYDSTTGKSNYKKSFKILLLFIQMYVTVIYDTISSDAALNALKSIMESRSGRLMTFQKQNGSRIDADFLGDWQGGGYAKAMHKPKLLKTSWRKQTCLGICNLNPICP